MRYEANPHIPYRSAFPPETPIGMAYVPVQQLYSVYEPETGFMAGTIFPELDKPWLGGKACTGKMYEANQNIPDVNIYAAEREKPDVNIYAAEREKADANIYAAEREKAEANIYAAEREKDAGQIMTKPDNVYIADRRKGERPYVTGYRDGRGYTR